MQKYNIFWSEKKVSAKGVPYMKATLKEENGTEHANVAIFSSFPNFADLMNGSNVMGEVKTTVNERGTSKVLEYPQTNASKPFTRSQAKSTWTPEKSKEVQEIKDLSFKIAGTQRDAVLISLAEFNTKAFSRGKTLGENILGWRKWLWENYDAKDTDYAPFPDTLDGRGGDLHGEGHLVDPEQ